jgi:penicillin-insensitive murein endopeptidase
MLSPLEALAGLWMLALPTMGVVSVPATVPARPAPAIVPASSSEAPAALLDLSDDELLARIEADPTSLGSLSIGTPGRAALFNGVVLPPSPHWAIAPNADSYATSETIAFLEAAFDTVYELFPETQPIVIGDISAAGGGHLKRHQSHQGGRDVDVGYYYTGGKTAWFLPASPANFDLARNWALVRALVTRTDVEMILLDMRVQRMLYKYALSLGEEKEFLDHVFQCGRGLRDAVVQHVVGHRTHYHVRFYNAVAQEMGRRAQPLLVQLNLMKPPVYTVSHVVQRGQTLGQLAARYGTSVRAIMQANGLRTALLTAGRTYRIPVRGSAAPPAQPLAVPHRVLPTTTPTSLAAVDWPTADSLYGPTAGSGQDR